MTHKHPLPYGWIILILLALVAYTLPWVNGGSASLSFGAFDLAEWASLHPTTRAMSPILLTSFLLRLPLVCFAWIVAFNSPHPPLRSSTWWVYAIICFFLVVLSTPPLEFLTTNRDDINYLQQASLTALGIIGCGIGLSGILKPFRGYVAMGICAIGAISSTWGVILGYNLLAEFQITVVLGLGIIGSVGIFALMGGYTWLGELKRRR
ncbi:MAG: hypothetical protein SFZ02_13535 [bacterium]|nr:hypothetical protein [bacterium]